MQGWEGKDEEAMVSGPEVKSSREKDEKPSQDFLSGGDAVRKSEAWYPISYWRVISTAKLEDAILPKKNCYLDRHLPAVPNSMHVKS